MNIDLEDIYKMLSTFWALLQRGELPEVGSWNYVLLAVLVAVEGPIATLLGAAAASAGLMRTWAVFCAAATGNLIADTLWYLLGYKGNLDTILKVGRLVRLKQEHLDHLTRAMQAHALKILFLAKLTAGFMIPTLIATGLARIPWRRWFPVLLLAETLWTGTLVLIGYYTTESIKSVANEVTLLMLGFSVLFFALVIWYGRRMLMKTPEFSETFTHDGEKTPTK